MKKLLASLACAAMCLAAAPSANAESVDMAKLSCADVLESKNEATSLVMWVDGYLSAESGTTTVSQDWIEKLTKHIFGYCAQNKGKTLIDAANEMPETEVAGEAKDIMAVTCKDFTSSGQEEGTIMLMWIDGYLSKKNNDTTMSDESMAQLGSALGEFCKNNPNGTLGQALK